MWGNWIARCIVVWSMFLTKEEIRWLSLDARVYGYNILTRVALALSRAIVMGFVMADAGSYSWAKELLAQVEPWVFMRRKDLVEERECVLALSAGYLLYGSWMRKQLESCKFPVRVIAQLSPYYSYTTYLELNHRCTDSEGFVMPHMIINGWTQIRILSRGESGKPSHRS